MGQLTKLAAVNRMLRAASELPVNSITSSGISDTDVAVTILDEANLMYQLEGKYFNSEIMRLYQNSDDKFTVGSATLSLIPVNDWANRNIVIRGGFLYDVDNNTYVFDGTADSDGIDFKKVTLLEFKDIPTSDQFMVCDTAAREYQRVVIGDVQTDRFLYEQSIESKIRAVRESVKNRKGSWLISQSTSSLGIIGRNLDVKHKY